MRRADEFSQPIRLSANTVGWFTHVIDEWLAERHPA
ncbi:MAG: AlpA family phage regulatory protein [Acidimicrobiaceae bacterium]|nr:AlpA family phage regulatory protein [Acidimicrobiaceae bacterium]MYE97132.1 AlpA family phage regulatory protein [Acidimicrobiaceae bacterium]MYI53158.1 AlpA family phage regulatory protein [Acidimicrobiaceae bacterium]